MANWISTNLVDAANTETERTTFDASTIHIVTNHENKLENSQHQSLSIRAKLTLSTSLNCLACSNASLAWLTFLAPCKYIQLCDEERLSTLSPHREVTIAPRTCICKACLQFEDLIVQSG